MDGHRLVGEKRSSARSPKYGRVRVDRVTGGGDCQYVFVAATFAGRSESTGNKVGGGGSGCATGRGSQFHERCRKPPELREVLGLGGVNRGDGFHRAHLLRIHSGSSE